MLGFPSDDQHTAIIETSNYDITNINMPTQIFDPIPILNETYEFHNPNSADNTVKVFQYPDQVQFQVPVQPYDRESRLIWIDYLPDLTELYGRINANLNIDVKSLKSRIYFKLGMFSSYQLAIKGGGLKSQTFIQTDIGMTRIIRTFNGLAENIGVRMDTPKNGSIFLSSPSSSRLLAQGNNNQTCTLMTISNHPKNSNSAVNVCGDFSLYYSSGLVKLQPDLLDEPIPFIFPDTIDPTHTSSGTAFCSPVAITVPQLPS